MYISHFRCEGFFVGKHQIIIATLLFAGISVVLDAISPTTFLAMPSLMYTMEQRYGFFLYSFTLLFLALSLKFSHCYELWKWLFDCLQDQIPSDENIEKLIALYLAIPLGLCTSPNPAPCWSSLVMSSLACDSSSLYFSRLVDWLSFKIDQTISQGILSQLISWSFRLYMCIICTKYGRA